jgi:hypothetical protein
VIPPTSSLAENQITTTGPISSDLTIPVTVSIVSGSLENASGAPLAGQIVTLDSPATADAVAQASSNASGAFELAAAPGTYDLDISGAIGDPTSYDVAVPNVNLTSDKQGSVVLPTETVAITVTSPSGSPVEGVAIQSSCAATSFALFGGTATGTECVQETTNATGEAALTVLPTSSLALTLTPQAGSLYATTSTTVTPRSGTTSVSVVLGEPLSITSASSVGMIVGAASAFMVTTQGYPIPAPTEGGKLPPGLTFIDNKNGTATLKGTPIGSSKTYTLTIKAANGFTTVTQSLAVTVGKKPTITSAASATFVAGKAGIFAVKSSGFPVSVLLESGPLPPGITFTANANGTATLAGTPTSTATPGNYPLSISAVNVEGTATQAFTLTLTQRPAFSSVSATTFTVGNSATFELTTSGYPYAALSEKGTLPRGVTFRSAGNGMAVLTGIPAAGTAKTYKLTITASNSLGKITQIFTLTVAG